LCIEYGYFEFTCRVTMYALFMGTGKPKITSKTLVKERLLLVAYSTLVIHAAIQPIYLGFYPNLCKFISIQRIIGICILNIFKWIMVWIIRIK